MDNTKLIDEMQDACATLRERVISFENGQNDDSDEANQEIINEIISSLNNLESDIESLVP